MMELTLEAAETSASGLEELSRLSSSQALVQAFREQVFVSPGPLRLHATTKRPPAFATNFSQNQWDHFFFAPTAAAARHFLCVCVCREFRSQRPGPLRLPSSSWSWRPAEMHHTMHPPKKTPRGGLSARPVRPLRIRSRSSAACTKGTFKVLLHDQNTATRPWEYF